MSTIQCTTLPHVKYMNEDQLIRDSSQYLYLVIIQIFNILILWWHTEIILWKSIWEMRNRKSIWTNRNIFVRWLLITRYFYNAVAGNNFNSVIIIFLYILFNFLDYKIISQIPFKIINSVLDFICWFFQNVDTFIWFMVWCRQRDDKIYAWYWTLNDKISSTGVTPA